MTKQETLPKGVTVQSLTKPKHSVINFFFSKPGKTSTRNMIIKILMVLDIKNSFNVILEQILFLFVPMT